MYKALFLFSFIVVACGDISVTDSKTKTKESGVSESSTKVKVDFSNLFEQECDDNDVVKLPIALNCAKMCVKYPEKEYKWCSQFDTYCQTEKGINEDKAFCQWWSENF